MYISLLSLLFREIPIPDKLKQKVTQRILNSINSINWLNVELKPLTVELGSNKTQFKIIPHFHEFDFEAVFNKSISYEREVISCLELYLSKYNTIIEIGANVGVFSIFFNSYFQDKKMKPDIFVFEPSREAYLRLLKNINLNSNCVKNIHVFNCAISDEFGFCDFFEPKDHLTNGSLNYDFAKVFSTSISISKMLAIDGKSLTFLLKPKERTLMKIDTEGAEYPILLSLKDILLHYQVDLVIEVLSNYQDKLNSLDFLFDKGYLFFNITDRGLVKQDKFVANNRFRDYLLLSPEN
ncbi:hypothetical protein WA1_45275 [Scytonema hofmannii PCC 7110]|uniref:Methyltransferase FkbM domain-containing protein n=1 Tax=Scytonema hofmannii PCC 7110 TaxID=128403 RepID=A0A139WWR1_9CYAN|nr:FkbM family methyltransferase [Scytonema hofmannii]KYC36875.1 hypothetical protein WA1_45275 [Scytonema hofmannii PCC 7110]